MARPRTPIGTFGAITTETTHNGTVTARTRYRDEDGRLRLIQASGANAKTAERNLKAKIAHRIARSADTTVLTADRPFVAALITMAMIGVVPGSVSILGLQYDKALRVRLCIDREITLQKYMRCHPCRNTSTLRIATTDVLDRLLPYLRHKPTIIELPRHAAATPD